MINSTKNESHSIGLRSIMGGPRVFCLVEYAANFFIKGTSLNSKPEGNYERLV